MFRLPSFGMGQAEVLDRLDRAIGDYRRLVPRLGRRLFKPFYRIGQGLVLLGSIPFRLLRGALLSAARGLDTTTLYGRFLLEPVTSRQIGHRVLLVQWGNGRKVVMSR